MESVPFCFLLAVGVGFTVAGIIFFFAYNWDEYFGGMSDGEGAAWNCTILTPSRDNSGTVLPTGGTDTGGKSFIYGYGDKLGGIYDRMSDLDVRKQPYVWDLASNNYRGMFLMGEMKANFGTGEPMKGDADRDGEPLVYVDQLGTFKNLGRDLEVVMSPAGAKPTRATA